MAWAKVESGAFIRLSYNTPQPGIKPQERAAPSGILTQDWARSGFKRCLHGPAFYQPRPCGGGLGPPNLAKTPHSPPLLPKGAHIHRKWMHLAAAPMPCPHPGNILPALFIYIRWTIMHDSRFSAYPEQNRLLARPPEIPLTPTAQRRPPRTVEPPLASGLRLKLTNGLRKRISVPQTKSRLIDGSGTVISVI